jgi:hypothetical protein
MPISNEGAKDLADYILSVMPPLTDTIRRDLLASIIQHAVKADEAKGVVVELTHKEGSIFEAARRVKP